jgi:uncharacterized protein YcfJ
VVGGIAGEVVGRHFEKGHGKEAELEGAIGGGVLGAALGSVLFATAASSPQQQAQVSQASFP